MENKNQIEREFLIRLRGEYQSKYGYEMDDWTTIILYEQFLQFRTFSETTMESNLAMEKATNQIKGQVKPVHFSSNKQAFWYGLTSSMRYLYISAAIFGCSFLVYSIVKNTIKYKETLSFLNEYKNIEEFRILASNSKILVNNGNKYLVLKPSNKKGTVRIGENYEWGSDKKKEIYVLLGNE